MTEEPENVEAETETAGAPDADAVSEETASNSSEEASPSEADASPATATEALPPKERRRAERAARAAARPTRPRRSAEERQAEREQRRSAKAKARRAERERARSKRQAARTETEETPAREHAPGVQKTRQGIVVSDRADKTITVRIDTARRHRRYQKIVRTSRTLHAHDESNDAHVGDTVVVRESRPLSRTKRWRLVQVIERAE
jgi:small subunit ribosomal protein S17